jgi:hypothetical protein
MKGKGREGKERKRKESKRKERNGKEGEAMHKKSQRCYVSRSHEGRTPGAILMKFGSIVYMVSIINSAKFDYCTWRLNGLNLARV